MFLPRRATRKAATAAGLRFVVVSTGPLAATFTSHGWAVRPLGLSSWSLAVQPRRAASSAPKPAAMSTKSDGSATKRNRGCSAVM
jgi:hypothetical protein